MFKLTITEIFMVEINDTMHKLASNKLTRFLKFMLLYFEINIFTILKTMKNTTENAYLAWKFELYHDAAVRQQIFCFSFAQC